MQKEKTGGKKKKACPLCKVLNFVKNYFLFYNAKICFLSFATKIYFLLFSKTWDMTY